MSELTVTEQAIIDFERQKEAHMARAKNYDPTAIAKVEPGDRGLTPDHIAALTAPVRVVVTFDDPIHTRQQIEVLQAALVEALVVTQDHGRGINRQRLHLRHIIKTAADALVYMNGKTPTGKKPIKPSNS
jgi:hypothetical protein